MASPSLLDSNKLVVAAIDLGTTGTGIAYYLKREGDHHNVTAQIITEQGWEGSAEIGHQAPTTVLMKPDKTFHSFGFEAEEMYKSLTLNNQHSGWYYFRNFKMSLHHERELSRDMLLADVENKHLKAMVVFTEAIRYVHDHLLKKIKHAVACDIRMDQVIWVMTVPAIWRDSAKQFMREASVKAGIPSDDLIIALEPESAAIYCKEMAVEQIGVYLKTFNPGEKYLVCDLGGGTVDTTVHRVKEDGTLVELYAATGGDWGGQQVNKAFVNLLIDIVGQKEFNEFQTNHTRDWIKLRMNFEMLKRQFTPKTEISDIDIPKALSIGNLSMKPGVEVHKDTLRLNNNAMMTLFDFATSKIISHIEDLLKKPVLRGVSSILLVGGFSGSPVVNEKIRAHFNKVRVISPPSAGSAIINGAVLFGLDQKIIAARISSQTFGIHTRRLYNKDVHPKERMKLYRGRQVVDGAFAVQIRKGSRVYVGVEPEGTTFRVNNTTNREVFWNVYSSTKEAPEFCDEDGCRNIGQLKVEIPSSIKANVIRLKVTMTCRGTELEAKAFLVDYPDVNTIAKLEFLEFSYELAGDFIED